MITIQQSDFDAAASQQALRARAAGDMGAVVTFVGYVRDYAPGEPTSTLFLDHYPGMCERELEAIDREARSRWPLTDTEIIHRVGALGHGEQIVFVAVASAHRGDAFRGCEFIIDALKTRAPFWKRETLADGKDFWVEQRATDSQRTAQWAAAPSPSKEPS